MSIYLREQSAGEILRGTVSIYLRNFLPLFGMYFLPSIPFIMVKLKTAEQGHDLATYVVLAMWFLVTPFAAATLTVGVSDVCLGNRPSLLRSLRRVFGVILGKLILTNLFMVLIHAAVFAPMIPAFYLENCSLLVGAMAIGVVLTVLLLIWWMFAPTVVVLERTFGWTALKRSQALGKGYYLRNTGVVLLLFAPIFILGWVSYVTLQSSRNDLIKLAGALLEGVFAPLPLIATVLLYYDLRARSEGYDLAMLGQDLRR